MAATLYNEFSIVLYEDATDYDYRHVLELIVANSKYYCWIRHWPEDDEKKPHYHVYFRLPRGRTFSAVHKLIDFPQSLDMEVNQKRIVKDRSSTLLYFLHYGPDYNPLPDKEYIYTLDDLAGNMRDQISELFVNKNYTDTQIVRMIKNYMFSDFHITRGQILEYVLDNGFLKVYNRYYRIFDNIYNDLYLEVKTIESEVKN